MLKDHEHLLTGGYFTSVNSSTNKYMTSLNTTTGKGDGFVSLNISGHYQFPGVGQQCDPRLQPAAQPWRDAGIG